MSLWLDYEDPAPKPEPVREPVAPEEPEAEAEAAGSGVKRAALGVAAVLIAFFAALLGTTAVNALTSEPEPAATPAVVQAEPERPHHSPGPRYGPPPAGTPDGGFR
jgi:hypothetical protein